MPSLACAQVLPPSVETATSLMPLPPSKAMPLSSRLCAGLQLCAIRDIGDERAYVEAVDRNGGFRRSSGLHAVAVVVGDAVGGLHPEAVEDVVDHRDFVEVLDPIGPVVARHDETQRKAVEERQVLRRSWYRRA